MATEKRSVVEFIAFPADGTIEVRLQKVKLRDGRLVKKEPHRMIVTPAITTDTLTGPVDVSATDLDKVLAANKAHLAQMGYPFDDVEGEATLRSEVADRLGKPIDATAARIDAIGFGTARTGDIAVRIAKLVDEDGDPLDESDPPRFTLEPDDDLDEALAIVETQLAERGYGKLDALGLKTLRREVKVRHTKERKAARVAGRRAQEQAAASAVNG